jgi:hypothetical protein
MTRMKKLGYIFFNLDRVKDKTGTNKTRKVIGIKTTEDLTQLSKFEYEIDMNNYTKTFVEMVGLFESWVSNPYENKFITFYPIDMKEFSEEIKNAPYKSKVRDFHKIMSYQYWNIENEMTYRMALKKDEASIANLLSIYGLSFIGNPQSASDLCFNMYSLVYHFKTDTTRNKEVFSRTAPKKAGEEKKGMFSLMDFVPIRATGEEHLRAKMAEGWNISIECKARGRGYGMTYEATAYHMDASFQERLTNMRFGVGKTLEELMGNLFTPEELNPYAQDKRKEYEQIQLQILK